ncbi:MAG: TPM domain-containing protein [Syntrophomonadaceae bacterium]|jgi:uncharacterized protein|nr:TPM domain-containing protein [Syntrophomonadaceae bacterium]
MKKITALFISIMLLTFAMLLPVHAADFDLVADGVGLLSEDEYFELNELAWDITEEYQCEVSIVIIDDNDGDDAMEVAKSIYEDYNYGYGEDKSGLMLFLSMEERDYAIIAYGYGNTAFTDHGKDVLLERHLLPLLGKDEYYDSFRIYLNQTANYLKMARDGTPFDIDTDEVLAAEKAKSSFWIRLAVVILVPLLIAGLICLIFLSQMKTAVKQRKADYFIPEGGFNLTRRIDQFLFRTETRTQIEKKSSSGGTSVGSDGFSGRSGKF